jgi:nuclear transport factor 2 (NTF2) superfamily protein
MLTSKEEILTQAYKTFNARDIDAVLLLMQPGVHWPNGWEGGYVEGHEGVRDYWTRQWLELNPRVEPVAFTEKEDGRMEVLVKQIVKDHRGNLLFDGFVKHVYTFENGLIKDMEIVKE